MKRSIRWVAGRIVMLLGAVSTAAHATVLLPGNTVFATNLGSFTSGSVLGDSGNVARAPSENGLFRMPLLLYASAACPSCIRFR